MLTCMIAIPVSSWLSSFSNLFTSALTSASTPSCSQASSCRVRRALGVIQGLWLRVWMRKTKALKSEYMVLQGARILSFRDHVRLTENNFMSHSAAFDIHATTRMSTSSVAIACTCPYDAEIWWSEGFEPFSLASFGWWLSMIYLMGLGSTHHWCDINEFVWVKSSLGFIQVSGLLYG